MSRAARQTSETGIYHVVFRGINRQDIFEENLDYEKLLEIMKDIREDINYEIYVYCLMSNHVHLMIKEHNPGEISLIMKKLLTRYVMWYNKKYERIGPLIAGRYKSVPIEIDDYFLCAVRYIHQNPVKSGIVESIEEYPWSSYGTYCGKEDGITSKDFINEMFSGNDFKKFHQTDEREVFIVDDKIKLTDSAIRRAIMKEFDMEPKEISALSKKDRNIVISALKEKYTIREIERITGISRGIISRI